MDFVEICNVCIRKAIIKVAKRIFNSDKICCSYCDFYFGITFWNTVYMSVAVNDQPTNEKQFIVRFVMLNF